MIKFRSVKQLALALSIMTAGASILPANAGVHKASWYGPGFHLKRAANGSIFNQNAMTTACAPHIRLNSVIKITNVANGKSVTVKCTDRGAFHKSKYGYRTFDLSKGAFASIASLSTGVIKVRYEILKNGDGKYRRT